jgi:hypothetical protein
MAQPSPPPHEFAWQRSETQLLLRITPDAPLAIHGALSLRCIKGAAACHGFVLRSGQAVTAHATTPALVLRYEAAGDETLEAYESAGDEAPAWLQTAPVVVEVTASSQQRLAITAAPDVAGVVRIAGVAAAPVAAAAAWRPLAEPELWREAARRFTHLSSVLVMGAQHAGKSTLCRYLANSSSQNVFLLDLDPGQPLAAPPGFVSLRLLDAPCLAEASAENTFARRIFLGATTPSDAPDAYVAAAALLKEHWARHLPGTKLLVNACGWVSGLGAEITAGLVSTIAPDACFICGDDAFARRPPLRDVVQSRIVVRCGSVVSKHSGAPPATRRVLRLAAYFSQQLKVEPGPRDANGALADATGRVADAIARGRGAKLSLAATTLVMVGSARDDAPRDGHEAVECLRGALVAVASAAPDVPLTVAATPATPAMALGGAWADALDCRGLALVRDVCRGVVELYAPFPLREGDLLLRGVLAPPVELLYRGPDHVRFDFMSSESVGADHAMRGRGGIGRKAAKRGRDDADDDDPTN